MRHDDILRPASITCALLLAACAAAALEPPAAEPASGKVEITVVKVRASGHRAPDAALRVDPRLEALKPMLERLPLKYDQYVHEAVVTRQVPWGEVVRVALTDSGGRLDVSAKASTIRPGNVVLTVSETAPGDEEACVLTDFDEKEGRPVVVYCDGLLPDGTILFFVSADQK